MKNVIDLGNVMALLIKRREINKIDVRKAIFTYKGNNIKVSKEMREHWRFTGLNTIDFAEDVFVKLITEDNS